VTQPDGIIREVLFPAVKEETFRDLVEEFRHSGPQYRLINPTLLRHKFVRHYRRRLPMLLENVSLRRENRFQPVIEAWEAIRRHVTKRGGSIDILKRRSRWTAWCLPAGHPRYGKR